MRSAALILGLGSLLAACSPSPPRARDQIRFQHGTHLLQGATCTGCHATLPSVPLTIETTADDDAGVEDVASVELAGAAGAEPAAPPEPFRPTPDADGARPLPKEATCRGCHQAPEQSRCGYCHVHPESAATYPDRPHSIRFDHGRQVPEHVRDCMRCHGLGLSTESAAAFEPRLPPMRVCTESCHAAEMSALACSKCHVGLSAYPREAIDLVRHAPGFLRAHGPLARAEDNLCAQCHEPTFCSECHTATPNMPRELLRATELDREFIHAADFQARHAAEAQLNQASCMRCHGVDFCDGCHQASGVGGGVGPGSPHPPGWLDAMSGNSHATEARRNILSCAGCHESDAEQTCVPCHRVGSIAGNPHPPGFGNGYDKNQQGVCRVCHGAGG